jgi:hypothetical protein
LISFSGTEKQALGASHLALVRCAHGIGLLPSLAFDTSYLALAASRRQKVLRTGIRCFASALSASHLALVRCAHGIRVLTHPALGTNRAGQILDDLAPISRLEGNCEYPGIVDLLF